jgi:hypothetical protein
MFISFDSIGCVNTVSGPGRHRGYDTPVTENRYYIIIHIDVTVQILYNDIMWLILDF